MKKNEKFPLQLRMGDAVALMYNRLNEFDFLNDKSHQSASEPF